MGAGRPRPVVLDAGALIAFERGDKRVRALARLAGDTDAVLVVPAAALAQAWRDGQRQARLAALMASRTSVVDMLDEPGAKATGVLCGRSRTADVVDASVVVAARLRRAPVVTGDPVDLRRVDPSLEVYAL